MLDPRFLVLKEALVSYASRAHDPPTDRHTGTQAAVSVIVRGRAELDLLLIKRAHHETDPWSGQMALPGGRWERGDDSLLDTAMRETAEETGVDLATDVHLGRLPNVHPNSPRLPHVTIQPFVFGVSSETRARAASEEVEAVHWVSLRHLRDPATAGEVEIEVEGSPTTFPGLRVDGEVVWGLTYRILRSFLDLYPHDASQKQGPTGTS